MRIGTWNVEYAAGADKNAKRMEIIRANPADIWVLTETHDDLDLSPTHIAVHSHQRPTGRPGARWVSIWTSFEVLYRIDVVDPERTVAAMLHTPLGPMVVYGTVLPWHSDRGKHDEAVEVPYWSEHHREIRRQATEWSELRDRHKDALMCVAGDLNMTIGGPHYYGTKLGRSLLAEAMDANRLTCVTSTDRLPPGALRYPPIDHILLSDNYATKTEVASAWEGIQRGMRLSDHSGLVVAISA
ncbi:MAG TPA: endonuclease/exonuclease/phosphatase family protein [Vitreimonas sp.]|uniref:endonuclease/exonuclease/phosphatase family protein n=1 Tax=Vitreimonas sp. TaxID=3069702 RepID=UPI002D451748|nr:endonuclease/exonuclease/phosphatase family protein [Vitreimonas sp.]HYD86258.1 endonuclease/exonuclease/phosphatase family protein [Vitreimonas sp.]